MGKKQFRLGLLIVLCIAVIAYVDLVVRPGYWEKTMVKAPIFFLVPIMYGGLTREGTPFVFLKWPKRGLKLGLLLGIGVYAAVVGAYLITSRMADLSGIVTSLEENLGIDKQNFLVVGLYVSLVNSFLEEWFFRGFVFHQFGKVSRGWAYLVSSSAFALYHVAIMDGMFGVGPLLLALTGLFIGGTIFNYLNERSQTIYPSWFCHIFANLAMNTIGILLFF